jgi:epsilon-lactone hydrolase
MIGEADNMSWQAAIVRWAIKRKIRRVHSTGGDLFGVQNVFGAQDEKLVARLRDFLDGAVASIPLPMRGTSVDQIEAGRIRGEWITAPNVPKDVKRVIFYLHGGGYFWGNLPAFRNMLARISRLAGARVFSLDYRLAPENPFPAALDDALAAYFWLIEKQHIKSDQLILGGDSAGGGLALSLLCALKEKMEPLPGAVFLFSPWTDFTVGGASIASNEKTDYVLAGPDLRWAALNYLNGKYEAAAAASPLFADLSGLPPILIQVGSTEILLDDSRGLADAIRRHDGRCVLDIWPRMHHVWQLHSFFMPEGRRALADVANFINTAPRPANTALASGNMEP